MQKPHAFDAVQSAKLLLLFHAQLRLPAQGAAQQRRYNFAYADLLVNLFVFRQKSVLFSKKWIFKLYTHVTCATRFLRLVVSII